MINIYNSCGHKKVMSASVNAVLKHFDIDAKDVDVEIELLEEDEIRQLNMEERDIDSVTDVLSFPALDVALPFDKNGYPDDINPEDGSVILGDIYICLKRAEEQAKEYNHALSRELGFLVAHGMLHLLGFDHIEESDREKMEALQSEILDKAGITRDISDDDFVDVDEENDKAEDENKKQYVGYIAILGRPNAGKSTLTNTLVGEKVAIVSWKPQTTRNKITGILNEDNYQMIFVDTPGLHAPKNALGKFMMHSVTSALEGVDIVLYVIDSEKGISDEDKQNIVRYIKESGKHVIVAVNKIDHVTKEKVAEILTVLSGIKGITAVVPVSALRDKNTKPLKDEIKKLLPEGEMLYPEDMYTDRNMRFMASEIIREKAYRLLDKEIPYGVGVLIDKYSVNEKTGVIAIDASVIVQKKAHKPIVLGKGGEMIKKISTYSRQDIEDMTGSKVFLTLWVKVKEDWRDDTSVLSELGYDKKDYE